MHTSEAPRTASSTRSTGSTVSPRRSRAIRAKARARSALRLHTRMRASGRATRIASRCVSACTPAPTSARSAGPSRASARVATPDVAAVRMAVTELASSTASSRPSSGSKSSTAPWCKSSRVPSLPGKTVITLIPSVAGSPTHAGIAPKRPRPSGIGTMVRSGSRASPAESARSAAATASMQSAIGSSASTCGCERTRMSMGFGVDVERVTRPGARRAAAGTGAAPSGSSPPPCRARTTPRGRLRGTRGSARTAAAIRA